MHTAETRVWDHFLTEQDRASSDRYSWHGAEANQLIHHHIRHNRVAERRDGAGVT
jgi:hypothetical protein